MKAKDFIIVALVLGIVGFFYFVDQNKKESERNKYIDSLYVSQEKILEIDSIENRITKNILDSVNVFILNQNEKIKALENQSRLLRIKNNELEKKYNSIVINRPEF